MSFLFRGGDLDQQVHLRTLLNSRRAQCARQRRAAGSLRPRSPWRVLVETRRRTRSKFSLHSASRRHFSIICTPYAQSLYNYVLQLNSSQTCESIIDEYIRSKTCTGTVTGQLLRYLGILECGCACKSESVQSFVSIT